MARYFRPDTLEEALTHAAEGGMTLAAGCTDLFPATEAKRLPGDILDLTGIRALRGIRPDTGGLVIGATTTWSDIAIADLTPSLHALQLAAREVGARQIQARGTLAGNLCNASPAADGVPPLLALSAEVELNALHGARRLPLSDFLRGPRQTDLRPGEIVTAIHLPEAALAGRSAFRKLGARSYLVISIAMVAVRVVKDAGIVVDAAVSVGACGPVAARLPDVEAALIGHPLSSSRVEADAVARALRPIDDVRADAAYRTTAAAELIRRCIDDLQSDDASAAAEVAA